MVRFCPADVDGSSGDCTGIRAILKSTTKPICRRDWIWHLETSIKEIETVNCISFQLDSVFDFLAIKAAKLKWSWQSFKWQKTCNCQTEQKSNEKIKNFLSLLPTWIRKLKKKSKIDRISIKIENLSKKTWKVHLKNYF